MNTRKELSTSNYHPKTWVLGKFKGIDLKIKQEQINKRITKQKLEETMKSHGA